MTVSQTRQIFTRLLRQPAPSPEEIAEEVTRVLRRNEEARIYSLAREDRHVSSTTIATRFKLVSYVDVESVTVKLLLTAGNASTKGAAPD